MALAPNPTNTMVERDREGHIPLLHTLLFAQNKHEPSQLALHRLQPSPLSSSPSSQNPKYLPRLVVVLATLFSSREPKLTQSYTKFGATNLKTEIIFAVWIASYFVEHGQGAMSRKSRKDCQLRTHGAPASSKPRVHASREPPKGNAGWLAS